MKTLLNAAAAAGLMLMTAAPAMAQNYGMKAEAAAKNIVEVAVGNPDFSTLVQAVQAAGLVDTLASPGPFTVFAPTNAAFGKVPQDAVAELIKPENKAALAGVLTYHVVAGKVKAADLIGLINAGGGTATVTTVAGGTLTAAIVEGGVVLTDAKGGKSKVVATDVMASNGVIHVIDTVVMP